jgi:hypothetical protein
MLSQLQTLFQAKELCPQPFSAVGMASRIDMSTALMRHVATES